MSTIKDVAKLAGVSISTVSIVINGNAKERGIPQATCDRILSAATQLNYSPNSAARRLRMKGQNKPLLGYFWPAYRGFEQFSAYMDAFQVAKETLSFDIDLQLQIYETSQLRKYTDIVSQGLYDAIIIDVSDDDDMEYLSGASFNIPVILTNKQMDNLCSVIYSQEKVASLTIDALKRKNITRTCLVGKAPLEDITRSRIGRIMGELNKADIEVRPQDLFICGSSASEGSKAIADYVPGDSPDCIIAENDIIARGVIHGLIHRGIRVPEDCVVLTYAATNMDNSVYFTPSLTEVVLPMRKMMLQTVYLIREQLSTHVLTKEHFVFDPYIVYRESFPA